MMFYSEPLPDPEPPLDKAEFALILVLILAWILPGLVGHEPWKPDEAYNFGLVRNLIESGDWLTFHLPDDPARAAPPLYFWTAAVFGKLLSPLLPLPDAVRLATGLYMGISALFTALAGRRLYGEGRFSALLLAGSFGLLGHAHQLIADSALLAGCSIAVYGFVLGREKAALGGLAAGAGIGIGFLAKGTVSAALFLPALFLLPLLGGRLILPFRFAATLFASALPWIAIWPWLLHSAHPDLFSAWLKESLDASLGLGKAAHPSRLFYLGILPWFAWPALPLAGVTLWREKGRLLEEKFLLPLMLFVSMLAALTASGTTRELFALPMLIPLALIATSSLDSIRRNTASAFNWFGIITFGLMASLFWAGWVAMMTGHPEFIAARIRHYHPDFRAHFAFLPFLCALSATLLWLWLITHFEHRARRAVIDWTGGIVMVWMILMTLWLPFLDSVKGYREMFLSMKAALPGKYQCIEGRHLGQPQRAMLDYYLDIVAKRKGCDLVLVQTVSSNRRHPAGVDLIWEGARAGDRVERYRLYRITTSPTGD